MFPIRSTRIALRVLAATSVCCASLARADDMATLRARVLDSYTAASAPAGDSGVVAAQQSITSSAKGYLSKLGANGKFSDLGYTDQPTATWTVGTHFSRVMTMAQAYSVPNGSLYHDASLKTSIGQALSYGYGYYCGDASCVVGNWWFWEIGVPNALGSTLLLMKGNMDATLLSNLLAALKFHVGTVAHMQTFTGENLLWCAMNHLRIALLDNDATELDPVKTAVETTCTTNSLALGDGIKPDHSFQQHGGQLYSGGYGAGYAAGIATYLQLTDGTAFAPSTQGKQNAIDYVADGVAWVVDNSFFDVEVIGREVTRPGSNAGLARDALVKMSFVTSSRQSELRAWAKSALAALGKGGIDVVALAEQLATTPDKATQPSGHRHYFSSDQSVHRRADYYSSIKMFSKRTKSGELVNLEGLQGSRQSDGRLYLVRKGDEYFGKHLWPAMDWSRLPGITVEQNGNAANHDYGVGTTTFVGGTGDGQNGVAAMDVAPLKTTLTAKKSWFFFDDVIVFLGSDIADTGTSPVETIVEQWPLSTTTQPLIADGVQVAAGPYSATLSKASALTCDGLGYFFPGGADVKAEIKDQSGDWSSLGVSSGSVSGRFLTLSLSHGTKPTSERYAYAIALAGQDLSTWKTSAPFTVLANDSKTAAVRAGTSAGVVFWAAGSLEVVPGVTLGADTPSVAFITDDGDAFSIAAADPAQGSGKATFTVSGTFVGGSADDSGATVDFAHGSVRIDRAQGATHSARLVRQAPPTPDAGATPKADASAIPPGDDASLPSEPPDAAGTAADAAIATADAGASVGPAGCGCAQTDSGALAGVVLWLFVMCAVRLPREARLARGGPSAALSASARARAARGRRRPR